MRYPLAGREKLGALLSGSGVLSGTLGLAAALARRAAGPLALPLAVGGGLVWLGRSVGDAFAEIDDEALRIKLGVLFDETIPLEEIAKVRTRPWKLLAGLGVRTNMRDMIAIVTKAGQVAELSLWRPLRLPVIPKLYHVRAQRLLVSPEKLDDFINEVRARLKR